MANETTTTTIEPLTLAALSALTSALLGSFDAGCKRDAIANALVVARDEQSDGSAQAFDEAIAFLLAMPKQARADARSAIEAWIEALPSKSADPPGAIDVTITAAEIEREQTATLQTIVSAMPLAATVLPSMASELQSVQAMALAQLEGNAPTLPVDAPPVEPSPVPVEPSPEAVAPVASEPATAIPEAPPVVGLKAPTGETQADAAIRQAMAETPANVPDPYASCVWLQVFFSRLGTRRDVSDRVIVTTAESGPRTPEDIRAASGAKRKRGRKGKGDSSEVDARTTIELLSACKEHASIESADNAFRLQIRAIALPSIMRGAYAIPIELMERVEDQVKAYLDQDRPALVERFAGVYLDAARADRDIIERYDPITGQRKAPGLWQASDYPSKDQAVESYKASASWVDIAGSSRLSTAMASRNASQMALQQREAWAEIRAALRCQAAGLLDGLTEALRPDDTGKRKSFQDSRVDKVKDWLKDLQSRNVTNDEQLQAIANRIRETLDGVADLSALRADDKGRDLLASKLQAAREQLKTLGVTEAGPRKFKKMAPPIEPSPAE